MAKTITTEKIIDQLLDEMTLNNEKINVSRVAKKLNLSHSAIYKLYPEKLHAIKQAQERQKNKMQSIDSGQEIEKLKKQITEMKQDVADHKKISEEYKHQNEQLWSHIQEVYGMYDEMLAERNALAEKLRDMK